MTEISIKRLSSNNQKKFPNSFPFSIGMGFISDLNQFSMIADTMWQILNPPKPSIIGFQIDLTYQLRNSFRKDIFLFCEFAAINFNKNLRFIRDELVQNDTIAQGFERSNAFGIHGPGLLFKISISA